jgi:hypothetical protein
VSSFICLVFQLHQVFLVHPVVLLSQFNNKFSIQPFEVSFLVYPKSNLTQVTAFLKVSQTFRASFSKAPNNLEVISKSFVLNQTLLNLTSLLQK